MEAALEAQRDWAHWRFEDRAAVFLKAAELLATSRRQLINAATMLGQSKTAYQAEIDTACELIDFLRFNVHFAERIYREQPESSPGVWNRIDHRPLEGFVYAITPFNFTAIGGNLPTAPALMGNVGGLEAGAHRHAQQLVLLQAAGGGGAAAGRHQLRARQSDRGQRRRCSPHRKLAGIHFTGSTAVFQSAVEGSGRRICRATRAIPGSSARPAARISSSRTRAPTWTAWSRRWSAAPSSTRARSAARPRAAYIPDTIWPAVRDRLVAMIGEIRMGDVADFRNFMGAVIDRKSFDKIQGYLEHAKQRTGRATRRGRRRGRSVGWFVQPTLFEVEDPTYRIMCEEIFGPVLGVHVYPAKRWRETLELVDRTGPYALTGAVWARDRAALVEADRALRHAAGNYYVNDKPTGAVVGQQPFGGARASGTNDKAGSILNLLRWVSPRTIKETLAPPRDWHYAYMSEP